MKKIYIYISTCC
uniref:Uncharacterized protein n=1 Tax=Anguilla anguilla TaxID=7936 RepID=A0A0E9QJ57_ANGAN